MQPKLRVIPGRHFDAAEDWHRPPRLRPVVETRERRRMTAAEANAWFERLLIALVSFVAGCIAAGAWGA